MSRNIKCHFVAPIDAALAHHGAIRAAPRAVQDHPVLDVVDPGPDPAIVVEIVAQIVAHALGESLARLNSRRFDAALPGTGAIDAHAAAIGAVIDALTVRAKDRLATSVGQEVAVGQQQWRRLARGVRRDVAVDVVVVMKKR